jgi:hypothetical protein
MSYKSTNKNQQAPKIWYCLLLLFSVSQSFASETNCKMQMTDHELQSTQLNDSIDPHAGHDMQSMGHSTTVDTKSKMSDCCDQDCQCVQNTCSSSNSMITHLIHSEFDGNKHTSFFDENKLIQSLASSALYRPPIIC